MSRSAGRAVAGASIAVVVYAAAVPWIFRPWFLTPDSLPQVGGSLGAISNADLHLNLWILAWVARAAVLSPAHLFDGNVFHPAMGTITGSENMLAHLPLTVPVLFATGDPLDLLRVVALESFTLAGLAVFLLVRHHTRDDAAALVAGAAYAFTPLRALSAPWPQYFGTQYLPFGMLAIDCWLARRRRRALVGLTAAVALQGLASVYVGAFTVMLLPVYAAVRLRSLPAGERWSAALRLGGALAVGVLLLVPAALPYVISRRAGVIPAIPAEVLGFGSLLPGVVFGFHWVPWTGAVAPVLALAGILMVGRRRHGAPSSSRGGPAAAAWAMAAVAVFLALGPYTYVGDTRIPTPYLLLHLWVPGFSTFRAPIRFLIVFSAALSALAGYALARIFAGRGAVLRWSVAGVLVLLVVVLAAPTPSPTTPAGFARHAAPVYRTLAERPPGEPVAELPAQIAEDDISGMLVSARAMTASTIHWQPLVNGYTAYEPLAAPLLRGILLRLPRPEALQALVDVTGARWLVVHRNRLRPEVAQLWPPGPAPAGLELVQRAGPDELYAITLPRRHDWTSRVQASSSDPDGRTFEGTPKSALTPSCRRGRVLNVELPPRIYPLPVAVPARVRFANDGDCTWPGIDVHADGLVVLRHRWHRPDGTVMPWSLPTRLIADVPPGAVVDDLMAIPPANEPLGRWTSEVELTQVGADEPIARAFAETDLVPVGQPAPAGAGNTR